MNHQLLSRLYNTRVRWGIQRGPRLSLGQWDRVTFKLASKRFLPLAGHALWPPTRHRGWSVWLIDDESEGLSLLRRGYRRPCDFSFSHPWAFCPGLSQLPCCHTDRPVWWRAKASGHRPSGKRRPAQSPMRGPGSRRSGPRHTLRWLQSHWRLTAVLRRGFEPALLSRATRQFFIWVTLRW